jgi:hypothetical protein
LEFTNYELRGPPPDQTQLLNARAQQGCTLAYLMIPFRLEASYAGIGLIPVNPRQEAF